MPRQRFNKLPREKQHTILAAATEEFAAHGFEGASYNNIIQKAGISKGAMYYYFEDKADLYVTVIKTALGGQMQVLADFGEGVVDRDSFWEALRRYTEQIIKFVVDHPEIGRLMKGLMNVDPALFGQAVKDLLEGGLLQTEAVIRIGQAVGAVRTDIPAMLMARITLAVGEVTDRWALENTQEEITEETYRESTDVWLDVVRRAFEAPDGAESLASETQDRE